MADSSAPDGRHEARRLWGPGSLTASLRSALRAALAALALAPVLTACATPAVESLSVEVVQQRPHDPQAFTQGLLLHDGVFYESTGLVGRSSLREVDPSTGDVVRRRDLPDVFAEGLALVGDELYQLTWRAGKAYVWDRTTFNPVRSFDYEGEGWGLCFDGATLYMSDGSATLTLRDPADFHVTGTVKVHDGGHDVDALNELECVGDSVYANVWLTDEIVRIDKASGRVTARIDASPLREVQPGLTDPDAVLNGIASVAAGTGGATDSETGEAGTLWLTGKLWPTVFEVRLVPRSR